MRRDILGGICVLRYLGTCRLEHEVLNAAFLRPEIILLMFWRDASSNASSTVVFIHHLSLIIEHHNLSRFFSSSSVVQICSSRFLHIRQDQRGFRLCICAREHTPGKVLLFLHFCYDTLLSSSLYYHLHSTLHTSFLSLLSDLWCSVAGFPNWSGSANLRGWCVVYGQTPAPMGILRSPPER